MSRFLVLFAREPAVQAREKGLGARGGPFLFRDFATGWIDAARAAGATPLVAAPPEDLGAWRRALAGVPGILWLSQRGRTLGSRLEDVARRVAALGGRAVFVGGDVRPSCAALAGAFEALEKGAGAVLSPAPDGGVSLLALSEEDLDLLGRIRPRRRTILAELLLALRERGRVVELLDSVADLDGRSALRGIFRTLRAGDLLRSLLRSVLEGRAPDPAFPSRRAPSPLFTAPVGLRAPPLRVTS